MPVFTGAEDRTNIGLIAVSYKEVLEHLAKDPKTHVNYLAIEGSVLGDHVLTSNGFKKSTEEVFLTENARYYIYFANVSDLLKHSGLAEVSTLDLLAYNVKAAVLEDNAVFHAAIDLATRKALVNTGELPFDPESFGGIGGLFKPGGVYS